MDVRGTDTGPRNRCRVRETATRTEGAIEGPGEAVRGRPAGRPAAKAVAGWHNKRGAPEPGGYKILGDFRLPSAGLPCWRSGRARGFPSEHGRGACRTVRRTRWVARTIRRVAKLQELGEKLSLSRRTWPSRSKRTKN